MDYMYVSSYQYSHITLRIKIDNTFLVSRKISRVTRWLSLHITYAACYHCTGSTAATQQEKNN